MIRPRIRPPPHPLEAQRLAAHREAVPFTRTDDPAMKRLAREAREVCETRIGMVTLLGESEEWVVACVGIDLVRIPRALSFCAYTILEPDVLVVEDASHDARFRSNPFVTDEHHVRFYAGSAILDGSGLPLGAVCVCDSQPRSPSDRCEPCLRRLAELASAVLECRLTMADAQVHYASQDERRAAFDRLDTLLLTLIGPRPACI